MLRVIAETCMCVCAIISVACRGLEGNVCPPWFLIIVVGKYNTLGIDRIPFTSKKVMYTFYNYYIQSSTYLSLCVHGDRGSWTKK